MAYILLLWGAGWCNVLHNHFNILLLDSEINGFESLDKEFKIKTVASSNELNAERIISSNHNFSAVFINPYIFPLQGIKLLRSIHQNMPGTPIYYVIPGKPEAVSETDIQNLAIQQIISKPIQYKKIHEILAPLANKFDAKELYQHRVQYDENNSINTNTEDDQYTKTLAMNFVSGKYSYFDLYLRTQSGKYLKLFNTGELFDPDRIEGYLKKGVVYFYIKKSAQTHYLRYCDTLVEKLLKEKNMPTLVKTRQVMNLGNETIVYLKNIGISESSIASVSQYLKKQISIIREMKSRINEDIKSFLNDVALYEHGVASATIALLMVDSLGFQSDRVKRAIATAAFFHDLGLKKAEDEFIDKLHPTNAKLILKKAKYNDPLILSAIEEHHERRDGSGFPKGLKAGLIAPLAEVIGISDYFLHLIVQSLEDSKVIPTVKIRDVFDWYSYSTITAFEKTFINLKKTK